MSVNVYVHVCRSKNMHVFMYNYRYRAITEKVTSADKVQVRYIDFGNVS